VEIDAGEQTRLRVLTERGNQAFEVETQVGHHSNRLIGLEINAIDHHAKRTLQRMIEMNLGASDLATRRLHDLLTEYFSLTPAHSAVRAHAVKGAGALQRIHA
jgi:hypothetical protein